MINFKLFVAAALLLVSVHQIQAKSYNTQFLSQIVQGQRQMKQMTLFNQDSMNALIYLYPAYQAILREMINIMDQLNQGFTHEDLQRLQTDTRALNFLFRDQQRFHSLAQIVFNFFDDYKNQAVSKSEVSVVIKHLLKNTCFAKYKRQLGRIALKATGFIFGYFTGTETADYITNEQYYQQLELFRQAYLDLQNGKIELLQSQYQYFSELIRQLKYKLRPHKSFVLRIVNKCYGRLNRSENQALKNLAKLFYSRIIGFAILQVFNFADLDKNGVVNAQEIFDLVSEISRDTQDTSITFDDQAKAQFQVFLNSLDKNQDKQVSREEIYIMMPFIKKMIKANYH